MVSKIFKFCGSARTIDSIGERNDFVIGDRSWSTNINTTVVNNLNRDRVVQDVLGSVNNLRFDFGEHGVGFGHFIFN
jgi:hypothetical protein